MEIALERGGRLGDENGMWLILAAAVAYLVGSFPAGYLAGRTCGVDLRTAGSGNVGATNALRVLGKGWGYAVFAADFLKGVLGVKVAQWIGAMGPGDAATTFGILGAVCAVLGHNFPVWLGFKGGKGISTSAGIMVALFPWQVFAAGLVAWLLLFVTTRYVSVASMAAAVSLPSTAGILWSLGHCDGWLVVAAAAMCALALWRHRPNIARLLSGTEKKFVGSKKDSQPPPGGS
jgi:glycerol-3-phosphate acyltransferase PlsY